MSNLLRSNLVVAAGTALSRVTGLLRVAVFAVVMGQTALADAYNGANNTPNAIYELLLGGVLSASLVPMFSRQAEEDDEDATSAVLSVAVLALTALTVVAVAAAPLIFRVFSLDVADDAPRFIAHALAVPLAGDVTLTFTLSGDDLPRTATLYAYGAFLGVLAIAAWLRPRPGLRSQ